MTKYQKSAVIVDAYQWFSVKNQDVGFFRHPDIPGIAVCFACGQKMHEHGFLDVGEEGYRVCPGDWIITEPDGEKYPVRPAYFERMYERLPDAD